jgi:flagellar assembly protein FliH
MSSSAAPAPERSPTTQVHPFPYVDTALPPPGTDEKTPSPPVIDTGEQARREELAREQGRQEGEARGRAAYEEQLEQARGNLRSAILEFTRERADYFRKVEVEVVQLALSIARKILHRESQVDPLLLAALVRVALDQIDNKTKVVVRVHPSNAADCRAYFARAMEAHEAPEVEEDPSQEADRCVLQTALGTTEIGIEVQLKEIERGLMDLMAQKPQGAA